jgi:hypothetical protein
MATASPAPRTAAADPVVPAALPAGGHRVPPRSGRSLLADPVRAVRGEVGARVRALPAEPAAA